jgi:hypothetical protein
MNALYTEARKEQKVVNVTSRAQSFQILSRSLKKISLTCLLFRSEYLSLWNLPMGGSLFDGSGHNYAKRNFWHG